MTSVRIDLAFRIWYKTSLARVVNFSELNASKMARRLSAAVTFPLLPPISARILQAKGAGLLHLIKFFLTFSKIFCL